MEDADVRHARHRRALVKALGTDDAERRGESRIQEHRSVETYGAQHLGEQVMAAPDFRRCGK
jgi:hypothetical protein